MKTIEVCPSTLRLGFSTYSPQAIKELFDGVVVSPDIEKSDAYDGTGHPCRLDFERFVERIGLPKKRAASVLDMFMEIPQETYVLIDHSFLNDKMKRTYKRVIEERKTRFIRQSEKK